MKFERIIKNLSSAIAAIVVFFMAGGMYLSSKGFVMLDDNSIVLVSSAKAQEQDNIDKPHQIPDNIAFPSEHILGNDNAPITLYEYSSFGCSHCADFHLQILPKLKSEFIDKGLLKIVFIPFPIDKNSMDAALLAECVPSDKYFDFINLLFKKQRRWGLNHNPQKVLKQYASLHGIAQEKTDSCLHNDNNAREIISNRQNALSQLGIRGTPSFVLSWNGHNELIPGLKSYEVFKEIISSKLPTPDQTK